MKEVVSVTKTQWRLTSNRTGNINKGEPVTVFSACLHNVSTADMAVMRGGGQLATVSGC